MKTLLHNIGKQKKFVLKSQGQSMMPVLNPKDTIFYKRVPYQNLQVNDIVLIRKNNKLITHRIIYRHNNYLITKGDSNRESDGLIYSRHYIAKVEKIKRRGKIINENTLYLMQSSLYFHEIALIKYLFEKEHISYVFLKGLPLHLYIEKTYPRRQYFDCDILLDKKDLLRAQTILKKYGYQKRDISLSKTQNTMKDKDSELNYFKFVHGFPVVFDLHLEVVFMMTQIGRLDALYPQNLIDAYTAQCLHNKQTIYIKKEAFPILSYDDLLVYLALHFFHHNYSGFFRLEIIKKIIITLPKNQINIVQTRMLQTIEQFKFRNYVYVTYYLLTKYYPETKQFLLPLLKQTPEPSVIFFIKKISKNVFNEEERIRGGLERFKNLFWLSPVPIWRRIFVFANPQVLYMSLWLCYHYLIHLFPRVVKKNTII